MMDPTCTGWVRQDTGHATIKKNNAPRLNNSSCWNCLTSMESFEKCHLCSHVEMLGILGSQIQWHGLNCLWVTHEGWQETLLYTMGGVLYGWLIQIGTCGAHLLINCRVERLHFGPMSFSLLLLLMETLHQTASDFWGHEKWRNSHSFIH